MFTIELKGVDAALQSLDPKIVTRAATASLNRTVQSGKTAASEEIRKDWNVKKSDLDPRITIRPARAGDMKAVITISGKSMSLSYFGARQITGTRVLTRSGKGIKSGKVTRGMRAAGPVPRGVNVQVLKGKDTALLRRAFLAKMKKSGHIGVFRRVGKDRLPIAEKNVVSIATMASKPAVMERLVKRIEERWASEFPHQLEYYLGRK